MNIVQVKDVIDKFSKSGVKAGKPWKKTFFVGIMEDGEERGISTFGHVDKGIVYEMELKSHDYEGKTYWNAQVGEAFMPEEKIDEGEPKKSGETKPKPKPVPDTQPALPHEPHYRIDLLKCTLIYFEKMNKPYTYNDVIATARKFEEYYKNG